MDVAPVSLDCRPRLAPRVRLQLDAVTGRAVLLYPEGILELNETAEEIVRRCDGVRTVAEIAGALAAEYEAPAEELAPDVLECLADLQRRQLITLANP